jgi:hypothetical protein
VADICLANQAADGDDCVGEVEDGVDDERVAFVAADEATEGALCQARVSIYAR